MKRLYNLLLAGVFVGAAALVPATVTSQWLTIPDSSIGNYNTASRVLVDAPSSTNTAEHLLRLVVDDAPDFLEFRNRSDENGTFAPVIQGHRSSYPNGPALELIGSCDWAHDNGDSNISPTVIFPIMRFEARRYSSGVTNTPPLTDE